MSCCVCGTTCQGDYCVDCVNEGEKFSDEKLEIAERLLDELAKTFGSLVASEPRFTPGVASCLVDLSGIRHRVEEMYKRK